MQKQQQQHRSAGAPQEHLPTDLIPCLVFHPSCDDDQSLGKVHAPDYESALELARARWPMHGDGLDAVREVRYRTGQARLERRVRRYPAKPAFHEAGHAVIGTLHAGRTLESVAIRPQVHSREGKFSPHHDATGLTRFAEFNPANPYGDLVGVCTDEDRVLTALAGPVSAHLYQRDVFSCWKNDADVVALAPLIGSLSHGCTYHYVRWLVNRTRQLLQAYLPEVSTLAQALIEHEELTGHEVRDLLWWRYFEEPPLNGGCAPVLQPMGVPAFGPMPRAPRGSRVAPGIGGGRTGHARVRPPRRTTRSPRK